MNIKLSNSAKELIFAYEKGYRVINGEVFSPFRKEPLKIGLRIRSDYESYYFSCRGSDLKSKYIPVHRLVAYQKYGNKIFKNGIHVRHLDGNSLNNCDDNILIGTPSENCLDKPKEIRLKSSIEAATKTRRFKDSEIEEIRSYKKLGNSYKEVMKRFNISSKGSLHFILNNNYVTSKL